MEFPHYLGDLEFEFRDCSTFDKEAEVERIERVKSEIKDEGDVVIQQTFKPHKRMTLPKLTFDNVCETKSVQSCTNIVSKSRY